MGLVIRFRSAQIATEKRKVKIGFILAINEPNGKIAEPGACDGLGKAVPFLKGSI